MTSFELDSAAPRYLRYDTQPILVGLDHHVSNLRCLLREAHATERLALLPPLTLHPMYNFDHDRDWHWDDYYDLDASTLVDQTGRELPLPIAKEPVEPLVCGNGPAASFVARRGKPIPAESRRYRLVVRHITNPLFRKQVPQAHLPEMALELRPSAAVTRLATRAITHMAALGGDEGFVGIHVRRGNRLGEYPAARTEPPHIKTRLTSLSVACGTVLFIASDEKGPAFFDPLREHYQVVQHMDLPFLEALVSGEDPDNYLLYRVECEILSSARLWIETLPKAGPAVTAPNQGGERGPHATLVASEEWRRSSTGLWRTTSAPLRRLYARLSHAVRQDLRNT